MFTIRRHRDGVLKAYPTTMRLALTLSLVTCLLAAPALAAGAVTVAPPEASPASDGSMPKVGAETGQVSVTIDRAKVIRLPEGARTVIVGNPGIADVTIQKSGVVVVTGKSYGITNVIALDGAGNMLAEATVSVRAPSDSVVVLQRGPNDRQSYTCAPACMPAALLGDGATYFNDNKSQIDRNTQSATTK